MELADGVVEAAQGRRDCQTAWSKAWTDDQDTWLAAKYGERPNNKIWKDTESYWALCAKEFEDKFKIQRTVKALMKRASLMKLSKSTNHVRQEQATKHVRQEEARQWPLKVEKWIVSNVRKNAHLSHSYLQRVAADLQNDIPNTPTRSIQAWRTKIKRMRPHLY